MGLYVYLMAVRDMASEFEKMLKINQFCIDQGVSPPVEVEEYFGDLAGESEECIRSEMGEYPLAVSRGRWNPSQEHVPVEIRSEDGQSWVSINLADIPDDIKALKVKMDW